MERNHAIMAVREAIAGSQGWIVDQSLFSNTATTISFEMPSTSRQNFLSGLVDAGLTAHIEREVSSSDTGDFRGIISMTFAHDEPDLKRDVPPFG
ncbi:MAG: hypothetical protein ABJH63_20240 [Rhizobiaceae bacterium]